MNSSFHNAKMTGVYVNFKHFRAKKVLEAHRVNLTKGIVVFLNMYVKAVDYRSVGDQRHQRVSHTFL